MTLISTIQTCNELAGISIPTIIEKRWGREYIYWNREYCMKRLEINPFCRGSLHFHVKKHETLHVVQGELVLEYNDGKGESSGKLLYPGESYVVPPGFQHRLCAGKEKLIIIEASTFDDPLDSIRVAM